MNEFYSFDASSIIGMVGFGVDMTLAAFSTDTALENKVVGYP